MTIAPNFSLSDGQSNLCTLQSFAGKWLILYFYPKDDTPGCTIQACSLRDVYQELIDLGADVVGISKDSTGSHDNFAQKHMLHFTLLSDPDGVTIKTYGAWGKKMFGKEGILRKTYIIDPTGNIRKIYDKVTPLGHGDHVVGDLKKLQAEL